jgi:hypothetical protein
VGLVDWLLESLLVLESLLEEDLSLWLFLIPNARDLTLVRRAKKSFFGSLWMLITISSSVGGRRHAWRGTKSVFHGIVGESWSGSWPSSFHLGVSVWFRGSRFGSGANDGGGGGWLGWSWSRVDLQVGETLDGVQLQEVLQVFWNSNRIYRFPEMGMRIEGDGNGTGAKAGNCEGDRIWVDPGAAEIVDVVDGQRSLINGRGEDDDGVGFVAQVSEASGSFERWIVDDGSKGADAFDRLLEIGVVFYGRGPGYLGCDNHDSA